MLVVPEELCTDVDELLNEFLFEVDRVLRNELLLLRAVSLLWFLPAVALLLLEGCRRFVDDNDDGRVV